MGLIRQSDVLDAFNLLTVLYKLDTATEIVHICPAVIGRVYNGTYISSLFTFLQFGFVRWLLGVFMFLYNGLA